MTGPRFSFFRAHIFVDTKHALADQKLAVASYRGLFPIVEVPAGKHGRLMLAYRPAWLIWGSAVAVACVLAMILAFIAACRTQIRNLLMICLSLLVCFLLSLR